MKKVYSNYKLLLKPIVETVFLNFRSMNAAVNKMLERKKKEKSKGNISKERMEGSNKSEKI